MTHTTELGTITVTTVAHAGHIIDTVTEHLYAGRLFVWHRFDGAVYLNSAAMPDHIRRTIRDAARSAAVRERYIDRVAAA